MKKLMALILSAAMLLPALPVYAEYDYSAMISDLSGKLSRCNSLGIDTDYEMVNFKVIERFEKYMNGDADNGVSSSILSYNDKQIKRLYDETAARLQSYIDGNAYPSNARRVSVKNLEKNGAMLYSGGTPVFSVGFGHFELAQKDVPEFKDFGTNNIQIEIGPTDVKEEEAYWKETQDGNPITAVKSTTMTKKDGTAALYIKNETAETSNVYHMFSQTVDCKPNTTYKFGLWSYMPTRTSDASYVSLNGVDTRTPEIIRLPQSNSWKECSGEYTTSSDREQLEFTISVSGVVTAYLDECYLYELDNNGEIVSGNLLKNPGFESGRSVANSVGYVVDTLKEAEANNVAVNLLLSPHYFPENLDADIYNPNTSGFFKYNICAPEAKTVLKNYLDTLLPNLVGYKSLSGIILANEPTFNTTDYPEFFNPLFREYLRDEHGTPTAMSQAYGKAYQSFEEVSMPADVKTYDALSYDWIEFNDKTLADWHDWMAKIVKTHLPEVPVSTKMMGIIEGSVNELSDRMYLTRGTDVELLGAVTDWAGNDSYDTINNTDTYYRTMFLYDYQRSAVGKPVYNSEDHLILDGSELNDSTTTDDYRTNDYSEKQRMHWGNSLWQGAVHGRSMSSLWVWERSRNSKSALYNSALTRPDIIAETGKRALDLSRLSSEVSSLSQANSDVALWYSKPSRLYDNSFSKKMMDTYKALLSIGKRPGIVSDKSNNQLSMYKVLVIPGAEYCTAESLAAVESFIANGGKVIYSDSTFSKNEYKNAQSNSRITSAGQSYSATAGVSAIAETLYNYMNSYGLARVVLKTASGAIPEGLDWTYSIDSTRLLVNAANMTYGDKQNVNVYMDGEKVTSMRELIGSAAVTDGVELSGYTPKLLEKRFAYNENSIKSISADSTHIRWTYENDESNTANIYKVLQNGMIEFLADVSGQSYAYPGEGSYLVKAVSAGIEEADGIMISAGINTPIEVSLTNSVITDTSVLCDITFKNTLDYYATGVLTLKIKNAAGEVNNCAYHKPIIRGGDESSIKISISAGIDPAELEIAVFEGYDSTKAISNVITIPFTAE